MSSDEKRAVVLSGELIEYRLDADGHITTTDTATEKDSTS